MKKNAAFVNIVALCSLLFITVSCKHGIDPTEVPRPLTILTPKGGTGVVYHVGDTVMVTWSINNNIADSEKVISVGLRYSKDGGATFPGNQMLYWGGSLPTDTTWYKWIIDSTQISNQFVIKAYEYSNYTPFDQTDPFSLVSP
jgi:hypothetical protein